MITTIIFDLDGLLADTERLHCMAYQDAFRAHGAAVSDHEYAEHWVRSGRGITEWLSERGLTLDPIALRAHKSRCYLDLLISELRPMEGALTLLERLHNRKKLALASSSYPDSVEGVLAGLGIAHYFQVIVTGLDVPQVKPAPDIFLAAAEQLGATPSQCVVLEDAEKGVIAASRAGMRCIAIPNFHTGHHDFSKATRVCSSLNEVSLELLDTLE
jgi:HAD superfamily hydrolase (TIGR01509 family)